MLGIAAASALLGACGGGSSTGDPAPQQATTSSPSTTAKTTTSSKPRPKGVSVKVMSTRYGRILFDGRGRALYLFTRDGGGSSRCYGDCASSWPPFLTRGAPRAASGAKSAFLGTARRTDGTTQVTYHGQPLYYYVGDRRPGDVNCQDVAEFGGTWLVVSPTGQPVR